MNGVQFNKNTFNTIQALSLRAMSFVFIVHMSTRDMFIPGKGILRMHHFKKNKYVPAEVGYCIILTFFMGVLHCTPKRGLCGKVYT